MNTTVPDVLAPIEPSEGEERNPRAMTAEKLEAILDAAKRLRENPLFEEYIRAVEEYRRENNTVPDAD